MDGGGESRKVIHAESPLCAATWYSQQPCDVNTDLPVNKGAELTPETNIILYVDYKQKVK